MRASALWSEAARDIGSGTTRMLSLFILVCTVVTGLSVIDSISIGDLVREAREFQERGASVTTITAPDGVSGRACERLSELPGVRSAGALRASVEGLHAILLLRSPLPMFQVSPGFIKLVGAGGPTLDGIAVPNDVMQALSAPIGGSLTTDQGLAHIGATYAYPSDGRRPGFGWAALITGPVDQTYDECWVDVWPSNSNLRSLLLAAVPTLDFTASDGQVEFSQLNTQLGASYDGHGRFSTRSTRFAPITAVIFAFIISWLALRLRRLELAARLHDGIRHLHLALVMLIEAASWLVPAVLIASAAGVAYASGIGGSDSVAVALNALAAPVGALSGGVLGSACAVAVVRERHLFSYFTDR